MVKSRQNPPSIHIQADQTPQTTVKTQNAASRNFDGGTSLWSVESLEPFSVPLTVAFAASFVASPVALPASFAAAPASFPAALVSLPAALASASMECAVPGDLS